MGSFERCRHSLRGALFVVALTMPLLALAQPRPCSSLPRAEQAIAREQGLCVDDKPPFATRKAAIEAAGAARGGAATSNPQGKVPTFQCAAMPDFVAKRMTFEQARQALPKGLRPRVTKRPSSAPPDVVVAQSTEQLDGNLCWASFVVSDGSLVLVPPLGGLTRDVATQRLLASGLRVDVREMPTDRAAFGRVFDQKPAADVEVARNSIVLVAVALATTIPVPDVVGRNLGDAQSTLSRFAAKTKQAESARPAGEVLAQAPVGGTLAKPGSEVLLSVSDGSLVAVPDVVKHPLAKAEKMLTEAGLGLARVEETSSAPVGIVTTQRPAPKTEVRRDTTVTLHVSAGLNVPGVVGRQLSDAQTSLRSFAVRAERVASERAEGEVLEQSPAAGTRAAARATITLSVSDGSVVVVPELHGMALDAARAELLRVGDLNASTPDANDAGTAIVDASLPIAGARVKRGDTVKLKLVPTTPRWAWIAGAAALLVAAVAGVLKWLRPKPRPTPPAPLLDAHFSPSIEFNVQPIVARTSGPQVPEIGLRAELVRGRPWAKSDNEEST